MGSLVFRWRSRGCREDVSVRRMPGFGRDVYHRHRVEPPPPSLRNISKRTPTHPYICICVHNVTERERKRQRREETKRGEEKRLLFGKVWRQESFRRSNWWNFCGATASGETCSQFPMMLARMKRDAEASVRVRERVRRI